MKRTLKTIYLVLLAIILPVCASCSNPMDISVQRYSIEEVLPTSFRSVRGVVAFDISNGGSQCDVQYVKGQLYNGETSLGNFSVEPFSIVKGDSGIKLTGDISLDDNVSLLTILSMAGNFNIDNFSVSVEARLKQGLFTRTIKKNKIPLRQFIKRR